MRYVLSLVFLFFSSTSIAQQAVDVCTGLPVAGPASPWPVPFDLTRQDHLMLFPKR
ncbi:MAG: hypothetical protein HC790_10080 [Acaryochloridaceae cyanobacterium CSU_3_4]|nr:hypothetical protein [Acaryochloridaceae cyanobacterium CSU_3_4]